MEDLTLLFFVEHAFVCSSLLLDRVLDFFFLVPSLLFVCTLDYHMDGYMSCDSQVGVVVTALLA